MISKINDKEPQEISEPVGLIYLTTIAIKDGQFFCSAARFTKHAVNEITYFTKVK